MEKYLSEAGRDRLDPILDRCVALYREQLDEDGQVEFKGNAKAFLRAYGFLAAILPYTYAEWEKLSIFLTFLVPKLPAPVEDDLSKGILEAIDMDSYRVEKQAARDIQLPDEDAEIGPVPTDGGGQKPEPEMDRLSNIVRDFNDRFGNVEWKDQDKIEKAIFEELPAKVAGNSAYQNAMENSDEQNARIEHDKALQHAITDYLSDPTELFKQFSDNESSAAGSPRRSSPSHTADRRLRPAPHDPGRVSRMGAMHTALPLNAGDLQEHTWSMMWSLMSFGCDVTPVGAALVAALLGPGQLRADTGA